MSIPNQNPLSQALKRSRSAFFGVALFSSAINILMLTAPLFMLQIYDRVLTSKSVPTLLVLLFLILVLYSFLGLFEYLRKQVLNRIGTKLDVELMALSKQAWINTSIDAHKLNQRPLSDLTVIRKFIGSNGLPVLFDLPWIPFYLAIVFFLHVDLGLLASFGALIVIMLTIINEFSTKQLIAEMSQAEMQDSNFSEYSHRSAEAIIGMGMTGNITSHWQHIRKRALVAAQSVGNCTDKIAAATKMLRMLLQSSILALGAYLAIFQEITPGTMIAASILAGRALSPIDMAIGSWKNFIHSRQSFARLKINLEKTNEIINEELTQLPDPEGYLKLNNVSKFTNAKSGAGLQAIVQGINLQLEPGDGLGIIGPSSSGKSSLARLMVGIWMPDRGEVRLQGATYEQYQRNNLGKFIGYLPQSVELLPGSVFQNIARFDSEVSDEEVVEAAQLAGVHELILNLPNGYATELEMGQTIISGGQAQRIALARAVLGKPALVVLDEPNSNLDMDGDVCLSRAIRALREQGTSVVIIAHRQSAISEVNKVLILHEGKQVDFGDKETVMKKMSEANLMLKNK